MLNRPRPDDTQWTILKLLKWTTAYFKSRNISEPRASGEILLAHVLKCSRIDLYLRYDQPLEKEELSRFKSLIKRRLDHEPTAYIVGHREFWSLDLTVSTDVLIPRPETECLVEAVLERFPGQREASSKRVLELGCGSGAISIALAVERPDWRFFALDRSVRAVQAALVNAGKLQPVHGIRLFCSNWFDALRPDRQAFDVVVSNPPYIPTRDIQGLQPEIINYEPAAALDGGVDGLDCLQHIIRRAHHFLRPGGMLFLEIGHDQGRSVEQIANETDEYDSFQIVRDHSGYDRVVCIRKKPE